MSRIAFVLTIDEGEPWIFAGRTPEEAAGAVQAELEAVGTDDPDDYPMVKVEARRMTDAEIDSLPEFYGW